MVWPAIGLGLAQAGLSFFGQKSKSDQANKANKLAYQQAVMQTNFQNLQAIQSTNFQNLQIQKQNEYAAQAYNTQVDLYKDQTKLNQEAANRAYESIQVNRNRQFTAMAFDRFNRTNELLEAVGAAEAAMAGGNNRSARLAYGKQTFGRYGFQEMQADQATAQISEDSGFALRDTGRQHYAADLQAWSQVAIEPYMQSELPAPLLAPMPMKPKGNTFNSGLAIGSALLGGLSTFNQFAPTDAKVQNWFSNG